MPDKLSINLNDLLRQRMVEVETIDTRRAGIRTPFFARFAPSPMTLKTWAAVMW